MLIISHSCTKLTSRLNHRNSTTHFSISVNRKIAIWMNSEVVGCTRRQSRSETVSNYSYCEYHLWARAEKKCDNS